MRRQNGGAPQNKFQFTVKSVLLANSTQRGFFITEILAYRGLRGAIYMVLQNQLYEDDEFPGLLSEAQAVEARRPRP